GARRNARLHLRDDLLKHERRLNLVVALSRCEALLHLLRDNVGDDRSHSGGSENLLRLALKLWLGQPHSQNSGKARQNIVFVELVVACLQAARVLFDLLTQKLEQTLLETDLVGAPLRGRDDVDEAAKN